MTRNPKSTATVGATSLFSTVEDLANWVRNFEEKRVGGAKVIELMLTKGVLNNGNPITYARGIQVLDYKGLKILTHDGGDAGFRSSLLYFPDQKFGVVVLANLGSIQPGGLARKIADIFLADQLKQPEPGKKPAKTVKISPKKLKTFSGTYWLESSKQVRKIVPEGEKLYYVWSDTYRTELAPISQTEFIMKGTGVEVTVGFSDRTKDRYDTIMVTVANQPPLKGKWIEPFKPTTELPEEYTGRYYSEELDFHYDLALEKDELFMKARNSGDKPLKALIKDYFTTYYGSFKIDSYLIQSLLYLLLDPVRAGIVHSAEAYTWSSINEYFSFSSQPVEIVDAVFVNELFGSREQMILSLGSMVNKELEIIRTKHGEISGNREYMEIAREKHNRRKRPTEQGDGVKRHDEKCFEFKFCITAEYISKHEKEKEKGGGLEKMPAKFARLHAPPPVLQGLTVLPSPSAKYIWNADKNLVLIGCKLLRHAFH